MYIAYISSEEKDSIAYESLDKEHNVYDVFLDIRHSKVPEGARTLMFDGETQLITIPRSSIDTTAIIDWTRSKT